MKTTDFLQKAKKYIIYANILPKGQHRLYTTPLMIQYTVNTMRFVLMSRIKLYFTRKFIMSFLFF